MVTSEHMNQLLKNVLKLIKKNIGNENAPWMTRIAAYTQQIIINSSEELLKDVFLPLAERVKKRTETMFHKEESLRGFIKSSTDDTSQVSFKLSIIFPDLLNKISDRNSNSRRLALVGARHLLLLSVADQVRRFAKESLATSQYRRGRTPVQSCSRNLQYLVELAVLFKGRTKLYFRQRNR